MMPNMPRGNMCRPMGPNAINDNMMMNEMAGGMQHCGGGSAGGPGSMNMLGSGHQQGGMMGIPPHMGMPMGPGHPNITLQQQQQQMMSGGGMGIGGMGGMNPCMGGPMGSGGGPPGGAGNLKSQHMMAGSGGAGGGNSVQAQMEWNKLQHQFYEERKGDGDVRMDGRHMQSERERTMNAERMFHLSMGPGSGSPLGMMGNRQMQGQLRHPHQQQHQQQMHHHHMHHLQQHQQQQHQQHMQQQHQQQQQQQQTQQGPRSQGPPPPYHQTQRSASVPIATQSPNPSSPNNPTSNLSLPSPRSALNSPADPSRQQPSFKHLGPGQSPSSIDSPSAGPPHQSRPVNHSNPSTPIQSHLSPNASLKDLELGATTQNNSGK